MRPINRIQPRMSPGSYKTYQILAPLETHWAPATCEQAGCGAYERGWETLVDETSELGQAQAHYIRKESGRGFTEEKDVEGLTHFRFKPGQKCFREHRRRLEREELFNVQGGDFRGNPLGIATYTHTRAADWVDDFANHQDRLNTLIQRG